MSIFDQTAAWREGSVVLLVMHQHGCCRMDFDDEEKFHYLELIRKDGSRHFIYENVSACQEWEADYMSRRFTSFHEFFTTETPFMEERFGFQFKTYERRSADAYTIMSLKEAREQLSSTQQLPVRITKYGSYDKEPDYHME